MKALRLPIALRTRFRSLRATTLPAETIGPPRFLDSPLLACPVLGPRRGRLTRPFSVRQCCLPNQRLRRPPLLFFRGSFSRPTRSLCTLHAHGYPCTRNTRFRLRACFTGRVLPAGLLRLVSSDLYLILIPPYPGFSWHTVEKQDTYCERVFRASSALPNPQQNRQVCFRFGALIWREIPRSRYGACFSTGC